MAVATIDLIPASYRDECRARRLIKWSLPIFTLICASILVARMQITAEQREVVERLDTLRTEINYSTEQEQLLNGLTAERDELGRRVRVLDGLRGGLRARAMFSAINAAATDDTWFRKWSFKRQGELIEQRPELKHAGYLIVLSSSGENEVTQAWLLDTHMAISGSALSHSSLSTFVDRLQRQSEISEARILRTSSRLEATREVIDFELAISVHSGDGYSS